VEEELTYRIFFCLKRLISTGLERQGWAGEGQKHEQKHELALKSLLFSLVDSIYFFFI